MNIDNYYDYTPRSYTLLELRENKVPYNPPQTTPPDSFIKSAKEIQKEMNEKNKQIFLEHIFDSSKKHINNFLSLPNYDENMLQAFLPNKKTAEVAYLYRLCSMKDNKNEIRVPANCFPFFARIPTEYLKTLEPIITSKNYEGNWNYGAGFIANLDRFSDEQVEAMTKLAKCKFNGLDMLFVAQFSPLLDNVSEKAEILNKYYGENLMESGLYNNDGEISLYAKVKLPNSDTKDFENYKEVFTNLDLELNSNKTNKNDNIDNIINTMSKNIKTKLDIFSEQDLNQIGTNILKEIPTTKPEEVLVTMQKLTQFANYSSLKDIGQELTQLNIGKFTTVGDINPIFKYLCDSKKLCNLSKDPNANYAFFITKKDLENKKEMEFLKQWSKQGELKNIKFINLEGWSDGVNLLSDDKTLEEKVKRIITKAKKLTAKDKNLTFREAVARVLNNHIESTMKDIGAEITTISIDAPPTKSIIVNQMKPDYPSSETIKSTINAIAKNYTTDIKSQKDLSKNLAKYLNTNLNVYSKQSIIDNLKIIHSKIEDYLAKNKLSEENVYLITPPNSRNHKSFELITKMYSNLYDFPNDKIIQVKDICQLNKYPKNSTFVVLDDIVGTGKSMSSIGDYIFYGKSITPDKHILFAPISGTDFGIAYLREVIKTANRSKNDKVIYIDTNLRQPTNLKSVFKNNYQKLNAPLNEYGIEGYGNTALCTAFPYMTPDNNSIIANDIMKYFVANYNCIKNPNSDMLKIEKDAYLTNIFGNKENL